jgi:hypothetical protein
MSVTDGVVAVLADQAADLIRARVPGAQVSVRLAPAAADDPYRWADAQSFTVYFDFGPARGDSVVVWLPRDDQPVSALARLIDGLHELAETEAHWGTAFPVCVPGHRHPANIDHDSDAVVVRCPQTGQIVDTIRPLDG